MKSLVALTEAFITDASHQYSLDPTRDIETVARRHREEGEPFLTITLDAYRVAFEAALEAGAWTDIVIPGFGKDGQLPAFLRGFVVRVFQRNGLIRSNPDWVAVRVIRQITGFAAKMKVECKPEYTAKAMASFVDVDARATQGSTADLTAVFAQLFDPVMRDVLADIDSFSLLTKHGNGASQENLLPNSRWRFAQWEERMEPFFPSWLYAHLNDKHAVVDETLSYAAETTPVRVSFVPKTAKGPRTIAIEPSWRMYAQQGLQHALVQSIEKRGLPPRFTDSSKNRDLAREGSIHGSLATIDLSSASDSVSSRLVWELTAGRPDFRAALFACRSSQAVLPDGTTLALNKFASMGSAVCFPIESMVFAAIAVYAMARRSASGRVITPVRSEVVRQVTVYGDDIIVPSAEYSSVVAALNLFGFKVNAKKSFHIGRFRESCGGDYFMGHDVSYVKLRRNPAYTTSEPEDTVSTVSFRNQLAAHGLWPRTVRTLDRALLNGLKLFPYGKATSAGLVRVGDPVGALADLHVGKFDRGLHVPMQKAWVQVSEFADDKLDGISGLHKSLRLAERQSGPSYEPPSYDKAGRAVRVRLNARWLPV